MKRPRTNNLIRVAELRVIDETGKNLGVLKTEEALGIAQDKGLDLIEVVPSANPPVAKIMEYGKFLYQEQKKEREGRKGQKTDLKEVRLSVRTSKGDLEFKAKQVDKFLQKRYKVRITLILKGREKAMRDFAASRLQNFLSMIGETHKIEQNVKHMPTGMTVTVTKL